MYCAQFTCRRTVGPAATTMTLMNVLATVKIAAYADQRAFTEPWHSYTDCI
jgi:hypothetical protein